MTRHHGVGGAWKQNETNDIAVGGVYKTVEARWIGVGGAWKQYFSAELPAPTGLTVAKLTPTSLRISWNAVTGADGYYVERSPNGTTGWTQVQDVTSGVTWDDTGRADGTQYFYRVRAYLGSVPGAYSSVANNWTDLKVPTLTVLTVIGTTTLRTTHSDGGSGAETGIRFYVSTTGPSSGFSLWQTAAANSTTKDLTGLAAGTTHWVFCRNYDSARGVESGDSSVLQRTTGVGHVAAPTVVPGTNCGDLDISWIDLSGNTGYRVEYRDPPTVTWSTLITLGADATAHTDTGLGQGHTRAYRIIPLYEDAEGTGDEAQNATDSVPTVTNTGTVTNPDANAVSVPWTGGAGANTISVRRKYGTLGTWATLTTNAGGSPYTDQDFSNWLNDPTSLTVDSFDDNEIALSWTNGATRGDNIKVDRRVGTGNWVVGYKTFSTSTTGFTDTGLSPSTRYRYRVYYVGQQTDKHYYGTQATNGCGSTGWDDETTGVQVNEQSAYTNIADQTTSALTAPTAPSLAAATQIGANVSNVWQDNSDNEANFRLEVSVNSGGYSLVAGSIAADAESYLDTTGYTDGDTLDYRVRAENAAGNSTWANASQITYSGLP